jgi:short-subunit dehydrogenase
MDIRKEPVSFKNKVSVISGADSPLGRQIAIDFASLGSKVVIIGQDKEKLSKLKADISKFSQDVLAISCDVSNRVHVEETAKSIINKLKRVNILVNAENHIINKSFEDSSIDELQSILAKNLLSNLYMTKSFFQTLREQDESFLINIISNSSIMGLPNYSAYCASKSAVLSLSESIHNEVHGSRLNIMSVIIGEYSNRGLKDTSSDSKNSLYPENITKKIIEGMRKRKFQIIIPQKYRALMVAKDISPKFTHNEIRKHFADGYNDS